MGLAQGLLLSTALLASSQQTSEGRFPSALSDGNAVTWAALLGVQHRTWPPSAAVCVCTMAKGGRRWSGAAVLAAIALLLVPLYLLSSPAGQRGCPDPRAVLEAQGYRVVPAVGVQGEAGVEAKARRREEKNAAQQQETYGDDDDDTAVRQWTRVHLFCAGGYCTVVVPFL